MEFLHQRPICVSLPGIKIYLTNYIFQGINRPPNKHTHPCHEIVCIQRDGETFFDIVPPLTEHFSKTPAIGRICSFLFTFTGEEQNDICQIIRKVDKETEVKDTFDGISRIRAIMDAVSHGSFGMDEQLKAEFRLFFVKLAQVFHSETKADSAKMYTLDDERIALLEDFFNIQMQNPNCSKQTLAAKIGVCERQLTRILRETYNSTFSAILLNSRMNTAQALLMHGGSTVEEIARAVGYTSVSSFRNAYKNFFGVYPKRKIGHM